jgi:hypothetical protein
MNPMEPSELMPDEFARHLHERRAQIREGKAVIYFAHSRSGQLARFLRAIADRIDPTGEARRTQR